MGFAMARIDEAEAERMLAEQQMTGPDFDPQDAGDRRAV
jgi:hydrogenase maturation factor